MAQDVMKSDSIEEGLTKALPRAMRKSLSGGLRSAEMGERPVAATSTVAQKAAEHWGDLRGLDVSFPGDLGVP